MNAVAPDEAIESELVCYYQNDELPTVWVEGRVGMDWTDAAPRSAQRLLHALGKARTGELIHALERMRDHPEDPLVQRICSRTMTYWFDDPNDWRDFQDLLDRIIAIVRAEV